MRLAVLASGLFLGLSSLAFAQAFETPEALLEAFYAPYFSGEFTDDDEHFRSAALQALYDEDAARTPEGEMGALDFDPYINGQEFLIENFAVDSVAIEGNRASADVSFTNYGEERELIYDLVLESGGWRIDDVTSVTPGFEYRLSEIFAEAASW
ncbi:MAG: DUF3828 domain-containing protein [Devosia sp.]|nr:DUF3828 domain-containing protein [Devosia sp.]